MFSNNNQNSYISLISIAMKNFKVVIGTFVVLWLGLGASDARPEEALGWALILTLFFSPIVGLVLHFFKLLKD